MMDKNMMKIDEGSFVTIQHIKNDLHICFFDIEDRKREFKVKDKTITVIVEILIVELKLENNQMNRVNLIIGLLYRALDYEYISDLHKYIHRSEVKRYIEQMRFKQRDNEVIQYVKDYCECH